MKSEEHKGKKPTSRVGGLIRWYIKWWWVFGIVWLVGWVFFSVLVYLLSGKHVVIEKILGKILYILSLPAFIFYGSITENLKIHPDFGAGIPFLIFSYLIPCYLIAKILNFYQNGKISATKILEAGEKNWWIGDFYIKEWWLFAIVWFFTSLLTPQILETLEIPEALSSIIWKILASPKFFITDEISSQMVKHGIEIRFGGEVGALIAILIYSLFIILPYLIPCYILAKILEFWKGREGNQ